MNSRALQKYHNYYDWWTKVEKYLIRLTVLMFLVLYAAQTLNFVIMQRGGSMLTAKIEKLEGKAVSDSQTKINTGTIELEVISNADYSGIEIFVNGDFYTSFHQKTISLTVKNNDIIEISGIHNEYPAQIRITKTSQNVLGINFNDFIKVNRNFVQAGRIRLK